MTPDRDCEILATHRQSDVDESDSNRTESDDPSTQETQTKPSGSSSSGAYYLLGFSILLCCTILLGPQVVEQYYYAATIGKSRAEYDYAGERLASQDLPLSNVSYAFQLVAQRVRPSVVSVNAMKTPREHSGLGSGVIMSEDGYILTNAHVLNGSSQFDVELHDRRRYKARLIGSDIPSDLALIKIDAPDLIPAQWGDSDKAEVGSIVWAIGSPYGYQQTVTSGIISGKDRPGDGDLEKQNMLQTDAAVNPGNSGGPLVDDQGRVIGINTSIFGETFQGISFAIPSSTAMFVYEQLKREGRVVRGYLGVYPVEVNFRDAERMDLPDLQGARLDRVESNSPASRAGFRRNDVIRNWAGVEIKEYKTLYRLAEMTQPNTTVNVTFIRRGKELKTQVTVARKPE